MPRDATGEGLNSKSIDHSHIFKSHSTHLPYTSYIIYRLPPCVYPLHPGDGLSYILINISHIDNKKSMIRIANNLAYRSFLVKSIPFSIISKKNPKQAPNPAGTDKKAKREIKVSKLKYNE